MAIWAKDKHKRRLENEKKKEEERKKGFRDFIMDVVAESIHLSIMKKNLGVILLKIKKETLDGS